MATKIADLSAITTPADGDLLSIVDVSDTAQSTDGSTRKITRANYLQISGAVVGTTDTQTLTNKTLTSPTIKEWTGWNESRWTFEYVSTTSIKVSGTNVSTWFTKGTKIRLQNNDSGTYLYFWVTADATFSTDTTITVTGEDDVPNATLTDGAFSYCEAPYGMKNAMSDFRASVYMSANQSNIPDATETIVELDTEEYDTNSNFNTGTYLYTVPITGVYLVTGLVQWLGTGLVDGASYGGRLKSGATIVTRARGHASGESALTVTIAKHLLLTKGDTIGLYAYQNSGGGVPDLSGSASSETSMTVQFVSL